MPKSDTVTKLQRGIDRGQVSAVEALENKELRDALKRTPLHYAAAKAKAKIVARLIELGADVAARDYRENTPLHHAAEAADPASVELLLAAGSQVDARNTFKSEPLHLVARGEDRAADRAKVARLLIERGALLNTLNQTGRTPLILAAMSGNRPLVDLLLAAGADPKITVVGPEGTALAVAREAGHASIAAALHKATGAD